MQIPARFKAEYSNFMSIPRWRRWLWAGVALFGAVYLGWCKWGPQPIKPGQTVAAVTSPKVADMERKTVQPKKLMVFTPKAEAVKKLKLPASQGDDAEEEIFEATDTPATRYGSTTTTFVNMSTGMPRSVVTAKAAPWFQFERGNTVGAEVGIGSRGRYSQGDYQRDILSVKGVVIGARATAISYPTETDLRIGARAEYRW